MVDVQWAFVSTITASIAHFVLRIILGKELGPEGLGIYTLAFAIYLFGILFAAFGIGAALTKYIAEYSENPEKIKLYVSSGFTSSIITGTIMGLVLFLLAPYIAISFFHIPELESLLKLTAICFPFIAIQKAVLGTLNGFRRMKMYAILNIIQQIAIVGGSIGFVVYWGMGVFGAVLGFVIPTLVVSLLCIILIRESLIVQLHYLWHVPSLWETTIFGYYIVLGNSISFFNTQISSVIIGYYLNPTEVGIYAVAVLLSQTLTLIPSAVQRVTTPITATLYGKGDIDSVRKIIFSTIKKTFLITLFIAAFIAIFGQYIILFFFSAEFFTAYIPLLILLIGMTIFAPFMAVGSTLSSIGKVHVSYKIHAVCAALNVILNIVFIPYYGIIGAAVATTTIFIFSFVLNIFVIQRYTRLTSAE